jgi:hypothetical protein
MRRFFQFRLRMLFVLVAIAAVPCTLLAWKMEHKRRERVAVAAIRKLGGQVFYVHEKEGSGPNKPPGPEWLRRLLGDDFFADLAEVLLDDPNVEDDDLAPLEALTSLTQVSLQGCSVTGAGVRHIQGCKDLVFINLCNTLVTDADVSQLNRFTDLKSLLLASTGVSDAGLLHLKSLKKLNCLALDETAVTNAGLDQLKALANLEYIYLDGTKVTSDGVAALQEALPDCQISWRRSNSAIESDPRDIIYEIPNAVDTCPEPEEPVPEEPKPEEPEAEERDASRMPRIRAGQDCEPSAKPASNSRRSRLRRPSPGISTTVACKGQHRL